MAFAENNRPLNDAGHFGQISRPVVVHEHPQRPIVHFFNDLAVLPAVTLEIVLNQPGNIPTVHP